MKWHQLHITGLATVCVCALAWSAHTAPAKEKSKKSAPADTTMNIKAGSSGKDFDSITIEGEDRVRVRFDRPPLEIDVDPATAPGLNFESVWEVLESESFSFVDPMLARPVAERTPYAPRPWLDQFRPGPVARFQPAVTDVTKWSLEVADSRGKTVASFKGEGKPPKEILWDGTTTDGSTARADLTYSYVLNASDRAGNKRSFLGDSFKIPARVVDGKGFTGLLFSVSAENPENEIEPLALEAASRLNQLADATKPVQIEVTAPSFSLAKSIADGIAAAMRPTLLGDPSRIATSTQVDAGGGELASVTIRVQK
jgi:hypothetical protein